jgi:hypothetical protein
MHFPRNSLVVLHRNFLDKLYHTALYGTPADLAKIIHKANHVQIKALSEISQNLLAATYPRISKAYLKKLNPYKRIIRQLGSSKTPITTKRKTLLRTNVQHGGLPFLAPLLAPIIGALLSAGIQAAV